ncbi:MAG: short-chain dehydrogenase [Bacteroidetes bacterium]|nr:MAG: short-chain dehydrogenase [Bacteroidota bacterium]
MLRLLVIASVVGVILFVAQSRINGFTDIINNFLEKWNAPFILSLFFVSETILGLIPPDFFIVWSNTSSMPFLMLSLLAFLSYFGGLLAYYIGRSLGKYPKYRNWLVDKFSSHFATFHRYGGFIIVFSALFPLPFSTITLVSGMIDYPFKKLALLGTTRLLRFFLYALVLFKIF